MSTVDLSGRVFGALTVIKYEKSEKEKRFYQCICSCGRKCVIKGVNMINGYTKSCGCKKYKYGPDQEKTKKVRTSFYRMRFRCYGNDPDHELYRIKGIVVSPDWQTFESFYSDMAESWFPGATLDRIDGDGNYSKENCRWVTMVENLRNKKSNKMTHELAEKIRSEVGLPMVEIAAKYNLRPNHVSRIFHGVRWNPNIK